jgi:hypothetical protein
LMVDRISGSAQQQPACRMPKDGGTWVFDRLHQPGHRLFFRHLQVGVYGSDHQIEAFKYVIRVIQ